MARVRSFFASLSCRRKDKDTDKNSKSLPPLARVSSNASKKGTTRAVVAALPRLSIQSASTSTLRRPAEGYQGSIGPQSCITDSTAVPAAAAPKPTTVSQPEVTSSKDVSVAKDIVNTESASTAQAKAEPAAQESVSEVATVATVATVAEVAEVAATPVTEVIPAVTQKAATIPDSVVETEAPNTEAEALPESDVAAPTVTTVQYENKESSVDLPQPAETSVVQYEELLQPNPAGLEDVAEISTAEAEQSNVTMATATSEPTPLHSPSSSVYSTAEEHSLKTVETNDTVASDSEPKPTEISSSSSIYSASAPSVKAVEVLSEEPSTPSAQADVSPADEPVKPSTPVEKFAPAEVEAQIFNEMATHPYHTPPRTPVRSEAVDFGSAPVTPATERYPRMAVIDTPRKQQEMKPCVLFPTDSPNPETQLLKEMSQSCETPTRPVPTTADNTPCPPSRAERPVRSTSPFNPGAPAFVPGSGRNSPSPSINPAAPVFIPRGPRAGRSSPSPGRINPTSATFIPRGPRAGRSSPSPNRTNSSAPPNAPRGPRAGRSIGRINPTAPAFVPDSGRSSPSPVRINPAAPVFVPRSAGSSPTRINPAAPPFTPRTRRSSPPGRINPTAPAFVPGSGRSTPSPGQIKINPAAPAFVPGAAQGKPPYAPAYTGGRLNGVPIAPAAMTHEYMANSNHLVDAIMKGDTPMVRTMLSQRHLDLNAPNEHGQVPAVLALEIFMFTAHANDEILRMLLSRHDLAINQFHGKHGKETLLQTAVHYNHEAAVTLLLQRRDLDVNAALSAGATALQLAVVCGYEGVVAQLLRRDDLDVNKGTPSTGAPIHVAIRHGWRGIIERLVQRRDLNVNCLDAQGKSPLKLAVEKGEVEIVRVLRSRRDLCVDFR